ncbi:MAG: hypothetical protein QM811_15935 [Pirellulales bacterium]
MSTFPQFGNRGRNPNRIKHDNTAARAAHGRKGSPLSNRARTPVRTVESFFMPPETWYEPAGDGRPYKIVVQNPGEGFRHVLTPDQIRARLAELPAEFVSKLEVVHLGRMTRKKASAPCYGMQWGATLYLYPIEESLVEEYTAPPSHAQRIEAKMYGGRWVCEDGVWRLHWSEESIQDFFANNILIHELGHILDDRNSTTVDRERYAEWFAIHYGYKPTQTARTARLGYSASLRRHGKQSFHVSKTA